MPGPWDTRCSYGDALGGTVTRVRGGVREAADGGLGAGLEGLVVEIHRTAINAEVEDGAEVSSDRAVARARTDAQGQFGVSTVLRTGTYTLVVRSERDGKMLAMQEMVVPRDGMPERVQVVLPLSPAGASKAD